MRMHMINPIMLCRNHFLGEHNEIHKHRHNFVKHHSIKGRIEPDPQIEPLSMQSRHDRLVSEFERRKYNHKSPYTQPDLSYLPDHHRTARVNIYKSLCRLMDTCDECRERIMFYTLKGVKA